MTFSTLFNNRSKPLNESGGFVTSSVRGERRISPPEFAPGFRPRINRLSLLRIGAEEPSIGARQCGLDLPVRNIFIWAAVILFVNQLFGVVKEFPFRSVSLEKLLSDLGAVGIFQYMAWYVVFRLLLATDRSMAARWRHLLIAAGICCLIFLPTSRMVWVAATGISICMWVFNRSDPKLRAAGAVLTALSVQELWGHVFFNLIAMPLMRAETAVVGTMLAAVRAGTVWQDNVITGPSGFGIAIYTGCSSFHNVSLAMLCWVSVCKLRHQDWQRRDFVVGAIAGGTMILLNLVRLYLMAQGVDLFQYWHEGMGAEIFAIGASTTILLISLYGTRSTERLA